MPNLRIVPILLCFAVAACTHNPYTRNHGAGSKASEPSSTAGAKGQKAGDVPSRSVPANGVAKPVQRVGRPVVIYPVAPGVVNRPENVQTVVKEAGDILRQLSKKQAQNALNDLKPGALVSENPQEQIAEMLIDTTTMEQALKILKALQHAKQE
jgi:hypothetical protein